MLMMLVPSTAADLWGTQIRAQRPKVQKAWEGDGPGVPGVYYIATIKLEKELALDTWVSKHGPEQEKTSQKTIGQPTFQEHNSINDSGRVRGHERVVSKWPRR